MAVTMSKTEETKTVTFRAPPGLIDRLDDHIFNQKAEGDIPRDWSRSRYLRHLVQQDLQQGDD